MIRKLAPLAVLPLLLALPACLAEGGRPEDGDEATGTDSGGERIVGGTKATGYPEAALVDMYKSGQMQAICSGAVIAPQVVLTAGHCVLGFNGWVVRTPFASSQQAQASGAALYDYNSTAETVDGTKHDVALVFLKTPIKLASYPTIAKTKLANGSKIVNVGRINNGVASSTALFVSPNVTVNDATNYGFPFDYIANEVIQSGDSGGPDFAAGTHQIVAVNSGAGGGTEVLARVDLVASWIEQQIASHGGSGTTTPPAPSTTGTTTTPPPAPTCAHALCAKGTKLTSTCDPCAATICAADSYCCTTGWDDICVGEVASLCGKSCP